MAEETQISEVINMKQLLEAGVHFGHQVSQWNPRMKPFIFGNRNGIHIIDLQQTTSLFRKAYNFVRDVVANGGEVLFVGTKKQAQGIVAEEATRCGMPFVNTRWLGGTLTNFNTIRSRVDYLLELKRLEEEGQLERLPKKEASGLKRQMQKLEYLLGGIVNLRRHPEAMFIIDTKKEYIAVREARNLGIPVVAVIDTNCDPSNADFPIPGNDDAIRAIKLFTSKIVEACIEGKHVYEQRLLSGEIIKREEEESPLVVEKRKVFVFKEYGEEGTESKEVSTPVGYPEESKESGATEEGTE